MNKFIWVRDRDKRQHYINISHIVRVTKDYSEFSYIQLIDDKTIGLSNDTFDTYEEVLEKIGNAS